MITRFEKIRTMSFDEMVEFLCKLSGDGERHFCTECKAEAYCRFMHKGYIDWLLQEVDERDDLIED